MAYNAMWPPKLAVWDSVNAHIQDRVVSHRAIMRRMDR
jgi:hypothetical protein